MISSLISDEINESRSFFIGIWCLSAQLVFMKLSEETVAEFCQSIPVSPLLSLSIFTIFLRKIIDQLICIFQKQMSINLTLRAMFVRLTIIKLVAL